MHFTNDDNSHIVMVSSPYHNAQHTLKPPHNTMAHPRLASPHPAMSHYSQYPQHTIEIIELVEVPAPSPRTHISVPTTASSSYASTSSSSSSASEEEEDAVESYCSSEEQEEEVEEEIEEEEEPQPARTPATSFNARMRRIEQWRDTYAKAVGAQLAPSPSRTKRKYDDASDEEDDTLSRSSKRSRQSSSAVSFATASSRSTSVHSCSACDAWFPDRGSLRQHGESPRTNEACRAAVEYDFEEQ